MDGSGNIYFIDSGNYRVRKIDAVTGTIVTVTDQSGFVSPYGRFKISGLAVDSPGNLYFSTTSCTYDPEHLCYPFHTVIYVIPAGSTAPTYVVNGAWWYFSCFDNGDGGPALQANLSAAGIGGLAIDNNARLVILDGACGARRIDSGGIINTFTPVSGADAVFDRKGNGFFAGGNQVLRFDAATGQSSLFAGTGSASFCGDGGPAIAAGVTPHTLTLDGNSNLFVDEGGGNFRVRRIDAETQTIGTVAGTGSWYWNSGSGDGGPALAAPIYPNDVAVDVFGNLYIHDDVGERIQKVDEQTGIINTFLTVVGTYYARSPRIATDGYLYVFNPGIYTSANGEIWRVNTATGDASLVLGIGSASTFALDSYGDIYFATSID